jgi:hypothetical protein
MVCSEKKGKVHHERIALVVITPYFSIPPLGKWRSKAREEIGSPHTQNFQMAQMAGGFGAGISPRTKLID